MSVMYEMYHFRKELVALLHIQETRRRALLYHLARQHFGVALLSRTDTSRDLKNVTSHSSWRQSLSKVNRLLLSYAL